MTSDELRRLADEAEGSKGLTKSVILTDAEYALDSALGPDAARLLADAMDLLELLDDRCPETVAKLNARFAALNREEAA